MVEALLSIGQLAEICNVSHKTLRYYDALELLKPVVVKQKTGYRFYERSQITTVLLIKQLQEIGVSLTEIKNFVQKSGSEDVLECLQSILTEQKRLLEIQFEQIQSCLERVDSFQKQCSMMKEKVMEGQFEKIVIKTMESRKIVCRRYQGEYQSDVFRMLYKGLLDQFIVDGIPISCVISSPLMILEQFEIQKEIEVKIGYEIKSERMPEGYCIEIVPKGEYACFLYEGTYENISRIQMGMKQQLAKEGYQISGAVITYYYISEAITSNEECFITEMQFPIQKIE